MKNIIKKKQSGFTLIEVVLVLAIGALIILMAVLAFQGAQNARRSTARTNMANQIRASVEQYAADNAGAYPTNAIFNTMATANNWRDPATGAYPTTNSTNRTSVGITYAPVQNCGTGNAFTPVYVGYAVQYYQENGSLGCTDNTK